MNRVAIGLCLATAFAVSLAAQAGTQAPAAGQQPPSTTQQPPSTQPATPAPTQTPSSSAAPGEMTLTGCLQKTADGFALANVMADSKSPSGAAAPTGTAGAATPGAASSAASGATSTWNLRGGSDLEKHVGHRIAVTGKAAAASSGAAGATPGATTAPPSTTTAASGGAGSARTLEVASIKMIAATCP